MNRAFSPKLMILGLSFAVVLCFIFTIGSFSHAQSSKKAKGLNFPVPDDWPIEKRGGILAPIPTEEYVLTRFKETEEALEAIKEELSTKIDNLESKIARIDSDASKKVNNVQPASRPPTTDTNEQLTEVLTKLKALEDDLKVLRRKMNSEHVGLRADYDSLQKKFDASQKKLKELQTTIFKRDGDIDYILEKLHSN